jgi:hypothetical protein
MRVQSLVLACFLCFSCQSPSFTSADAAPIDASAEALDAALLVCDADAGGADAGSEGGEGGAMVCEMPEDGGSGGH